MPVSGRSSAGSYAARGHERASRETLTGMLIVMAGLPGAGKSRVAEALAARLRCPIVSVDPIEAAMWRAGIARDEPTGLAAYVVAEEVARAQLQVGNTVIVDAVNDVEPARQQWRLLAESAGCLLTFVEVSCSDPAEHRRRLEARRRDIKGFPEPSWASVVARRVGFHGWEDDRIRVDSLLPQAANLEHVLELLARVRG